MKHAKDVLGSRRAAVVILMLLLLGDLLFIGLHFLNCLSPLFETPLLNLEAEGGYPEMYQYFKFFVIALTFVYISQREGCPHFLCWALVFVYFLLDDSLQLHEQAGGFLAVHFSFAPFWGLRLKDLGEVFFSLGIGVLLLSLLSVAYARGSREFRRISLDIVLLVVLLAFFGVVIDMVHMMVSLGWKITFLLGVVEDGGEMISVSLILWYTLQIQLRSPVYLADTLRGFHSWGVRKVNRTDASC